MQPRYAINMKKEKERKEKPKRQCNRYRPPALRRKSS
jgi:hypothetical protein